MTLDTKQLKDISALLAKEQQRKEVEKEIMRKEVVAEVSGMVQPILNSMEKSARLNKADLVEMAKTVSSEVISKMVIPTPKANVKVDAPIIPEIKVPEARVTVDIPEIKVPKIPKITVPKPEVTVNVPKSELKWPKSDMPVKGKVSLDGIDSANPLSVQLRDSKGKPVDLRLGGSSIVGGGGKTDNLTIKGIEPLTQITNGVSTTTAGVAVQLSSTSLKCKKVTIVARTTNENTIVVGGAGVVASIDGDQIGEELYPGSSVQWDIDDLNKIWLDVLNSNDGINYAYHI